MELKIKRVVTVSFELLETDAEVLAADLSFLLEHTRNLPGVVKVNEAPFVIDSHDRLSSFVKFLQKELRK